MQLSSGTQIPDGILAAITLRNENSRLGVPSKNPALHQGIDASKMQNAMELESPVSTTRVESRCTGKERDYASGNDYFGARYYSSNMGRFLTPDWSKNPQGVPYADFTNPQSLNLYSYVENNPLSKADPDGHCTDAENAVCAQITQDVSNGMDSTTALHAAPLQVMAQQQIGTNHHFKTANQAATSALNAIFPTSEKQHVEYGGRIYKNGNGTYSYTTPVTQKEATEVDVDAGGPEGSRIPSGTTNAGIYHTHESVPGYIPDQFSTADAMHAVSEHVPNYIETPSGLIHEVDGTNANSYLTAPQYTWPAVGPIP